MCYFKSLRSVHNGTKASYSYYLYNLQRNTHWATISEWGLVSLMAVLEKSTL